MNAQQWHATTTTGQANARAIGRKRYNAGRQRVARERQKQVLRLLVLHKLSKAEIARRLQVHPSTISRDVARLVADEKRRQGID
jgi:DNA-binding CsgD family transcriptional regulator